MPRIYKGSETILKLLIDVPSTSVIDKIKIALFTTDRSIAMEFYADSITLYGNIAYLNAPEWTFMEMQDGIINYIAQGESDNKPFIFERQSNYILKSSDGFEMSEIMNGYYTKEETDVKLEAEQDKLVSGKTIKTINGESVLGAGNITIKTDLTGYATEQWVKQQGYVTDSDVNDYVGNEIGQVEERFNDYYTKPEVDDLIKNIDIPEGGGSADGIVIFEYPQDYDLGGTTMFYSDSDRQAHNAECYNKVKNGEAKVIYMKHLLETVWHDEKSEMVVNWLYIPMTYRDTEWDGYLRLMSIYNKDEYGYSPVGISAMLDEYGRCQSYSVTEGGISEVRRLIYLNQTELGEKIMYSWDAESVYDSSQVTYVYTVVHGTDKGTQVIYAPLMGGRYENDNGFENYVYAFIGDEKWTWYFPNGAQEAAAVITPIGGGSGDSYTKEEIDSMIGDINNILTSI